MLTASFRGVKKTKTVTSNQSNAINSNVKTNCAGKFHLQIIPLALMEICVLKTIPVKMLGA
jgi:hypothetical protein